MDVNSFLSLFYVPGLEIFTSESQKCAIRLNWMADLACDQAGGGLIERNPCFREGVHVGEGFSPTEIFCGCLRRVNLPVTGQIPVTGPVDLTGK